MCIARAREAILRDESLLELQDEMWVFLLDFDGHSPGKRRGDCLDLGLYFGRGSLIFLDFS